MSALRTTSLGVMRLPSSRDSFAACRINRVFSSDGSTKWTRERFPSQSGRIGQDSFPVSSNFPRSTFLNRLSAPLVVISRRMAL